jgi:hypothetical protein
MSSMLTGLMLLALLAGVIRLRVVTDPDRATRRELDANRTRETGTRGDWISERDLRRHSRHLVSQVEQYLASHGGSL